MHNLHEQIIKVLSHHGSEQMIQFVSIAGFASAMFLEKHPKEFAKLYGTYGQRIIKNGTLEPKQLE